MIKCFRKVAIALTAVGLLTLGATGVATADSGSQYWYLDSEGAPVMERLTGSNFDGQTGSVTIAAGQSQMWLADEAAMVDLAFPDGDWITTLKVDASCDAAELSVEIGRWDGAVFTAFATTGVVSQKNADELLKIETQDVEATVLMGQWLALKVTNVDATGAPHTVDTGLCNDDLGDSCSTLTSPCSDPGYPTPELSTIMLMSLGALGLAGYVLVRRRRVASAQAA